VATSNLIPSSNNVFTLGNATNTWAAVYANNAVINSNVTAGGTVSATGNITGNYVLGNGALLTGVVTSVSNINNGTSNVTVVSSGGNVSVGIAGTGNVAVFAATGEYITGVVSATGNVTGNYFIGNGSQLTGVTASNVGTLTTLSVTGNTTTGNLLTGGVISAGGNIATSGLVSAVGNISGNYFIGNGSQLSGISSNKIYNGNSYANIATANGNVVISAAGQGWTFDTTGNLSLPGAAAGENIGTQSGYITVGNLLVGGLAAVAIPASWDYVHFMGREGSPVLGISFMWIYLPFVMLLLALVVRCTWATIEAVQGRGLDSELRL
jgi:hypothetical protein